MVPTYLTITPSKEKLTCTFFLPTSLRTGQGRGIEVLHLNIYWNNDEYARLDLSFEIKAVSHTTENSISGFGAQA